MMPATARATPTTTRPGDALAVSRRDRVRLHFATPLYKNAWALVLNTGITSTLGIAYWALAARRYSPTEVGRTSALISAMVLISGFAQFSMQAALPRLIPVAGRQAARLVGGGYAVSMVAATVGASAYLLLASRLGLGVQQPFAWQVWFVAAVVSWTIFTLQDAVLAGLRQATWVPIENACFSVGKIVLLLALAGSLPRAGLFASWTIPVALSLIPISLLLFGRLLPAHARASTGDAVPLAWRTVVSYVAGEYLGGVFSIATVTLLPLLVAWRLGLAANGYFYSAWVVGMSFDLVLQQVGTSLTVEGANDERAYAVLVRRAARFGAMLILPLVVVCIAAAGVVLGVLGSAYAAHATGVLRIISLAVVPRAVIFLCLCMARIRRRMREVAAIQAVLCALVLLFATVGLSWRGAFGVACGYALAQLVVALALLPRVWRVVRKPAPHADARVPLHVVAG
jgi:O-antigen/teichoic acid export membrane protein